jgi:hypothetical protein
MVQSFAPNTAPSEAQMRLAIGQILSMPFAYNAPVIVLDFDPGTLENEKITGRFKDLTRSRVFSFEINKWSVTYKPFTPRIDSQDIDLKNWEDFSAGYSYRSGYSYRADVGGAKREKAQCVKPTSYNCGSICINIKKSCRANADDSFSEERIDKLLKLRRSYTDKLLEINPSTQREEEALLVEKVREVSRLLKPYKDRQKELLKPYEDRQKELEKQKQEQIKEQRSRQIEVLKSEAQSKKTQLMALSDELDSNQKISSNARIKASFHLNFSDPESGIKRDIEFAKSVALKLNKNGQEEADIFSQDQLKIVIEAKKEIDNILDKARELIKVEKPVDIGVVFNSKNVRKPDEYKKGLEMFSEMISVPNLKETLGVKEVDSDSGRSYYYQGDIYMANPDPGTIIHESGHWLEARNLQVRREVQEFYNKRTEGEPVVKLSQVTGNPSYNDSEVTKVDKWLNSYMGKFYGNQPSSEVLSMGLEMMYRNPIYLAKNDPEMFDFIYSVVRQGN